ncbi:MAG: RNA polymerase sigma-70 factor [Bacteroidetes bacterium]|nr:RNA polymerase sigma-70 factor [Bacteroidota bacterium]
MDTTLDSIGISATGANDQHAFEAIYRQYFIRLFRFCYAIVHEKGPAEEIANDVFLSIWKKRDSLTAIDNLEVYLYISAKNHCLNYLRSHRHPQPIDIEALSDEALQFQADPESLLIRTETMKSVVAAIDRLPPRCKLIFKLIKEDGLKYKDVAKLLDLSVKTVEAQLTIAIRKIAQALR